MDDNPVCVSGKRSYAILNLANDIQRKHILSNGDNIYR